jgi:Flp pilus assembly pilin Flp
MKKSELMRHYDLIMWSVFVFEWLCLISAVSVIVHEYDNIISFVCAAMIGCVAFVVGRLGDDFEKYCRTIEIDQLSHLNRFERRRLIREMRKNGDL